MMKYCFAYFNKLGDFYGVPFFVDHKDGIQEILHQSMFAYKKEDLDGLKELDLYFVGDFDNCTGILTGKKDFVCSMSGMAEEVLLKKFGGKEDGSIKN